MIRFSIGLIAAAAALPAFASADQAAPPIRSDSADLHFQCERGTTFSVERRGTTAVVQFGDRSYRLARKPASIGVRFASPEATLIIDGDFAAFVAKDRFDLDGCMSTESIATRRAPGGG